MSESSKREQKPTELSSTACFVTLHMVHSQRNEFCVVFCLVHPSFSSNLMSSLFCVPFVFVFFHPFILFACSLLLLLPVFMHGRDEKNWNHRAVTQVGFSLIGI